MPRPLDFPQPWRSAAQKYGGGAAFAKLLGVSYMTLYRWAHGINVPTGDLRDRVLALAPEVFRVRPS